MSEPYDVIVIGAGQGGGPLAGRLAKAGQEGRARRAHPRRRHLHQRGLHAHQDHDRQRPRRPPRSASRRLRRPHRQRRCRPRRPRTRPPTQARSSSTASAAARRPACTRSTLSISSWATRASPVRTRSTSPSTKAGAVELTAPTIVVDVGTRPAVPPIDGLDSVGFHTNASLMELAEVPEHLVIIGGGYVGVEFGQMFRRFGSRVTLLQHGRQLLADEDADIAEALTDILRGEGLDIWLEADTRRVESIERRLTAQRPRRRPRARRRGHPPARRCRAAGPTPTSWGSSTPAYGSPTAATSPSTTVSEPGSPGSTPSATSPAVPPSPTPPTTTTASWPPISSATAATRARATVSLRTPSTAILSSDASASPNARRSGPATASRWRRCP